jgi:ADP-ribosylglycohydrolase
MRLDALLRAHVRSALKGICHPPSVVHDAYFRWYATQQVDGSSEVVRAIDAALDLAANVPKPALGDVESLGGGWVGEEALAIALYSAIVAPDFERGLRIAVNHGGDSDSTGSLTGNLLGALYGVEVIPERWLRDLELKDVIEELAVDLAAVRARTFDADGASAKYPGW